MNEILITMGVVAVIVPCVQVKWDPSTLPTGSTEALTYEVFLDTTSLGFVPTNTIRVCTNDFYVDHQIYVVAQDSLGNRSEPSDKLDIRWRFPLDRNKDGLVGFVDFFGTIQNAANESYGKCNNGITEYTCPAP